MKASTMEFYERVVSITRDARRLQLAHPDVEDVTPEEVQAERGLLRVGRLSDAEWKPLFRRAVGTRPTGPWNCIAPATYVSLWIESKLVAFMGVLQRMILVNGSSVMCGGLCYGATAEGMERRGYNRIVVDEARSALRAARSQILLITSLDASVEHYRKMGLSLFSDARIFIRSAGDLTIPMPREVFVLGEVIDSSIGQIRTIDFRGLPW